MKVFKVTARQPSTLRTSFSCGGKYYSCKNGVFYCASTSIEAIAKVYGDSVTSIEEIGEGAVILTHEGENTVEIHG